MFRDPELAKLNRLFDGHTAGHYTLPAELVAARETLDLIPTFATTLGEMPDPETMRNKLAEAIIDAARTGAPMPGPDAVLDADARASAHKIMSAALTQAHEVATVRMLGTYNTVRRQVITDHLRPALDQTLTEAAEHAPAWRDGRALTPVGLLSAPAKVRTATVRMGELAARYSAIRTAQSIVNQGQAKIDTEGIFHELRNLPDIYGRRWESRSEFRHKVWPEEPTARLAWLIDPTLSPRPVEPTTSPRPEVWLPTPEEMDERYEEVFGDAIARQARVRDARMRFGAV